jgi:endonuclease/exonuclease/phosphatase family metal-dependent hydrolase
MSEKLMILNVSKGGYDSYKATADQEPEREQAIREFIDLQHEQGVNTVVLSDTFLWQERYENRYNVGIKSPGIANHLGFRAAFHVDVNDSQLNAIGRENVGLTVATDLEVVDVLPGRVGDPKNARNTLMMHLESDAGGFDLGAAYLSEANTAARWNQLAGLDYYMNGPGPEVSDGPSLIVGDLNMLRSHADYSRTRQRIVSSLIHMGARAVGNIDYGDRSVIARKIRYAADTLRALDDRALMGHMRRRGYRDADAGPTYPSNIPLLDLDHVLHRGVHIIDKYTVGNKDVSDHKGLVIEFEVPPLDK